MAPRSLYPTPPTTIKVDMFYETKDNKHGLPRDPFKSCIVPRPIGWITTLSAEGVVNLAPYSFFNGVSYAPPIVMFAPNGQHPDGGPKDSLKNIGDTGDKAHAIQS